MILLFGDNTRKASSTHKTNTTKNTPVENSGILAMGINEAKSLLTMGEYDTYVSSSPVTINYADYANYESSDGEVSCGFMGEFAAAVAVLGDCGFSSGSFDSGSSCSSSSSCSSFSSCC